MVHHLSGSAQGSNVRSSCASVKSTDDRAKGSFIQQPDEMSPAHSEHEEDEVRDLAFAQTPDFSQDHFLFTR